MGVGFWPSLKQGVNAGVLSAGYAYARNVWYTGDNAPVFGRRVDSLSAALAIMQSGDLLVLGPQAYTEGNLVAPAGLDNITIIGSGNRGSCFIEPSVAGDEGLTVLGDGVTLINVGVADGGSGTQGLLVGNNDVSPSRFRAYGCKFEGSAIGAKLQQAGDAILEDCEFAWANTGLQLASGAIGFNTQIVVKACRFHNNADACIGQVAAAQQVNNFQLLESFFDQLEDGTEPTDFILLADNGNTGFIAGNFFALATNASAKLTIGTGLMWGPNGTEAGWSTARPA